jgi:hypothetical protein
MERERRLERFQTGRIDRTPWVRVGQNAGVARDTSVRVLRERLSHAGTPDLP